VSVIFQTQFYVWLAYWNRAKKNISDCMYFKYDFGYVHRKVHAQRAEQKINLKRKPYSNTAAFIQYNTFSSSRNGGK